MNPRGPREPSNPLRMIREEVAPEHATRGELKSLDSEVKIAIGVIGSDVIKVKGDVETLKQDMALVKAAVVKPDGKSALDLIPTKLEKTGTTGVLMLLVILTLARMLGLQLPSP